VAADEADDGATGELLNGRTEVGLHRLLKVAADDVQRVHVVRPDERFLLVRHDVLHNRDQHVAVVKGQRGLPIPIWRRRWAFRSIASLG
jgi:hypothetical protein